MPLVCLSVSPQHSSQMNDPKVFKLGIGKLGYTRSDMLLELKDHRTRSQGQQ